MQTKLDIIIDLQKKNAGILGELQGDLNKLSQGASTSNTSMGKLAGAFAAAQIAVDLAKKAIGLFIEGLKMAGRAIYNFSRDSVREFEQFQAASVGIARTMGITTDEAYELSKALFSIKTPTSIEELQEISKIAGSMGIAKDEALSFVTAIDKINVALGDEFAGGAEEITKNLSSIANQFGFLDDEGRVATQGIIDIGNALNDLGASGVATGAEISDFLLRVGAIAKTMKVSMTDMAGLGATLKELGLNTEFTGTSIQKTFSDMTLNTKDFAKVAGISLERFKTLLKEDANEALIVFLEGLKRVQDGGGDMAAALDELGIKEVRQATTLTALTGSLDLLRRRQDEASMAVQNGTSITDEYNKTLAQSQAQSKVLAKLWDEIKIGFGEALNQGISPIKAALIEMGTQAMPVLQAAFEAAAPVLRDIAENFVQGIKDNWPSIKENFQDTATALGNLLDMILGVNDTQGGTKTTADSLKELGTKGADAMGKLTEYGAKVVGVIDYVIGTLLIFKGMGYIVFAAISEAIKIFYNVFVGLENMLVTGAENIANAFIDVYNTIKSIFGDDSPINHVDFSGAKLEMVDLKDGYMDMVETARVSFEDSAVYMSEASRIMTQESGTIQVGVTEVANTFDKVSIDVDGSISRMTTSVETGTNTSMESLANLAISSGVEAQNINSNISTLGPTMSRTSSQVSGAAGNINANLTTVGNKSTDMGGKALSASGVFGAGMQRAVGAAGGASSSITSSLYKVKDVTSQSGTWGRHFGENLAAGMRASGAVVGAAAQDLANKMAANLQHTVPSEGPLKDDDIWGYHFAENLAKGMDAGQKLVQNSSNDLATSMANGTSSNTGNNGNISKSVTINVTGNTIDSSNRIDELIMKFKQALALDNQNTRLGLNNAYS